MKISTKRLATLAILLALCVIGANIKILGSIALDSFPAFVGAVVLGPFAGALLGFFGHMISALLAGFPNSLPIHLIIGGLMGLCMFVYGWIRVKLKNQKIAASAVSIIAAYLVNVPLSLVALYPLLGSAGFALFLPLTLATVANLGISEVVILGIPSKYKEAASVK